MFRYKKLEDQPAKLAALNIEMKEENKWYDETMLQTLVYSSKKNVNPAALKFVFLPQGIDHTFTQQLSKLAVLNKKLGTHCCFIATEPASFDTSHFIVGILFENNLFIINPLGFTQHRDFYRELAISSKNLRLDNLFICKTRIQVDPNALVSCGPICVELLNHLSTLPLSTIQDALKVREKPSYHKEANLIYLEVNIAGSKLLPQSLQSLLESTPSSYKKQITAIRKQHQSTLIDEQHSNYDEYCITQSFLEDDHDIESDARFLQLKNRINSIPRVAMEHSLSNSSTFFKANSLEDSRTFFISEEDLVSDQEAESKKGCCCIMQ